MSKFKKLVQARVAKTGESWSTAARHVRDHVGFEKHSNGVPVDGFCGHCNHPVRAGQDKCEACGWLFIDDPFECLLHDELEAHQREAIELQLTAVAQTGPKKSGEIASAYALRMHKTLERLIIEQAVVGAATETVEAEDASPAVGDARPPSDEWLSVWRSAWSSLATYCHTRDRVQLEAFNEHVNAMHALDASATIREVRRMVDEIRPEWDASNPVQPDLLLRGSKR